MPRLAPVTSATRGSADVLIGTQSTLNLMVPQDARIFVAGHRGLVGSAIVRRLEAAGYTNLQVATREQLDLRDQAAVNYWFRAHRPEYVYLVAGTVGGVPPGCGGTAAVRQPSTARTMAVGFTAAPPTGCTSK